VSSVTVFQMHFQNTSNRFQSATGFLLSTDKRMDVGAQLRKMSIKSPALVGCCCLARNFMIGSAINQLPLIFMNE
jgi:hypothetical protein